MVLPQFEKNGNYKIQTELYVFLGKIEEDGSFIKLRGGFMRDMNGEYGFDYIYLNKEKITQAEKL